MKIDIFHDTVCPWCRIGKHNLQRAIEEWNEEHTEEPISPEIRLRTFYLDPNIPEEGIHFDEYIQRKFGGAEAFQRINETLLKTAEHVGLTFRFDRVQYMPNTTRSHYMIAIAPKEKQLEIGDAIYKAYFEDGRDIGQEEVLLDIVEECGVSADTVKNAWNNPSIARQIGEDLKFAHQTGITGVPFFIFNDRYAITGAQPVSTFKQIFEKLLEKQMDEKE